MLSTEEYHGGAVSNQRKTPGEALCSALADAVTLQGQTLRNYCSGFQRSQDLHLTFKQRVHNG